MQLLQGIPQQKPSKNTNVPCPILTSLHHQSVVRLFHAVLTWEEAAQHMRWTHVPCRRSAALVLPVFSPSWETQGSAVRNTSILANETHHHHILENIGPAGKQGSSVPGADPVTSLTSACCICSCYQTGLPTGHLQLLFSFGPRI